MRRQLVSFGAAFALVLVGLGAGGRNVHAEEVTLVYTGETHAMIYPCNCPYEPDGGVRRRATLVNQIRAASPSMLLVDAGAFFAGGPKDEYSLNIPLDEERTRLQVKAMSMMGYDAAALGVEEFFFGREFLKKVTADAQFPLVACNGHDQDIKPFVIRQAGTIKVGITGVTPPLAGQKSGGIVFDPPEAAVAATVAELRKRGVDLVILLSQLGEQEDLKLIRAVEGIDLVVEGNGRSTEEAIVREGRSVLLRCSWEGRKLGKAQLFFNQKKLVDVKVEEVRLSDKIADDKQVQAMLPACFSDKNCKKDGVIGLCQEPGSALAQCRFPDPVKVPLLIINAQKCRTCDTQRAVDSFKRKFPGLTVSTLTPADKKAAKLLRDLDIKTLPVYLFGKELEKDPRFPEIKERLEPRGDYYLLLPRFGGIGYFLGREPRAGAFDFFISLFDPNAPAFLEMVMEFRPELHFLVREEDGQFVAKKGPAEVEETLRCLCVQKHYPALFWNYIRCRSRHTESAWWEDCLSSVDPLPVKQCAQGEEGKQLLRKHIKLGSELEIVDGPAYLLDNQEIFSSQRVPQKEELRKILYGK